jgi:hypothetical protein
VYATTPRVRNSPIVRITSKRRCRAASMKLARREKSREPTLRSTAAVQRFVSRDIASEIVDSHHEIWHGPDISQSK